MATGNETEGVTTMGSGQNNRDFLASLDAETSGKILAAIADDYGHSVETIFNEVVGDEAEDLPEYMIEPLRTPTSLLMKRFNARKAA